MWGFSQHVCVVVFQKVCLALAPHTQIIVLLAHRSFVSLSSVRSVLTAKAVPRLIAVVLL